jgi:hypothetical protein
MDYEHQFSFNGAVFPYSANVADEDEDYCYNISACWYDRDCEICITRYGLSLFYDDGSSTTTNIEPGRLFSGKKELTTPDLKRILKLLEDIGAEGKTFTKEQNDFFYGQYLKEVRE